MLLSFITNKHGIEFKNMKAIHKTHSKTKIDLVCDRKIHFYIFYLFELRKVAEGRCSSLIGHKRTLQLFNMPNYTL